jgi:thymidylate kinase
VIVAIVGADGAGKSTVSRTVGQALGGRARVVDRWDIVGGPDHPVTDFLKDDSRQVRSRSVRMAPHSRFLFLVWASVSSLVDWQAPQAPQAADSVVILDGYWMKHAASEIAYGLDRPWVEQVVAGLPGVDVAVYLRSDPETSWDRMGGRAVPYECALDPACAKPSFIAHQRKIHAVLDQWAARSGWLTVDARQPLDAVVGEVVRGIAGPGASGS